MYSKKEFLKKEFLKIISVIITLVMIASFLVSCKDKEPAGSLLKTSDQGSTASSKATTKTASVTTIKTTGTKDNTDGIIEDENPDVPGEIPEDIGNETEDDQISEDRVDFGGTSVLFAADSGSCTFFNSPYDPGITLETDGINNYINNLRRKFFGEAKEKFNVNIEFLDYGNNTGLVYNNLVNAYMAGLANFDFHYCINFWVPQFTKNGWIQKVDDYIDFMNDPDFNSSYWYVNSGAWIGNHYGFGTMNASVKGCAVNIGLFENEGLPSPYDLYYEKTWNWGNLLDIAVSGTRDINGDGIIDQIGITITNVINTLTDLIISNNEKPIVLKDGAYVYNMDSPEVMRCLQFFNDIFHTYRIAESGYEKFAAGKALVSMGEVISGMRSNYTRQGMTKIGWLPCPMSPDSNSYSALVLNSSFYAISSTCKNVRGTVEIIKKMCNWNASFQDEKVPYDKYIASVVESYLPSGADIRQYEIWQTSAQNATLDILGFLADAKATIESYILNPMTSQSSSIAMLVDSARQTVTAQIESVVN